MILPLVDSREMSSIIYIHPILQQYRRSNLDDRKCTYLLYAIDGYRTKNDHVCIYLQKGNKSILTVYQENFQLLFSKNKSLYKKTLFFVFNLFFRYEFRQLYHDSGHALYRSLHIEIFITGASQFTVVFYLFYHVYPFFPYYVGQILKPESMGTIYEVGYP